MKISNPIEFFLFHFRSAHYNNLQKQEEEEILKNSSTNNNNNNNNNSSSSNNNSSSLGPLKDNSNIKPRKSLEGPSQSPSNSTSPNLAPKQNASNHQRTSLELQPKSNNTPNSKITNRKIVPLNSQNLVPKLSSTSNSNERPLKCLETLAQKAGVTITETINQPKMDKSQGQTQQVPLQISPEQLQQIQQQYQLQQAFAGGTAIQVKQEFPQNHASTIEQLNKQFQEHNQAQVQQMQLIDASNANSQQQQQQQQHQQQQAQNNAAMSIKYVNGEF